MITMNRRDQALAALDHLAGLPERPPLVVVDQGSVDGTAAAVAARHPTATVLALRGNHGAAGRNIGVAVASTPYVAFSDDDSWWEPGALHLAAEILDAHPQVGLVAGRVLVGPDGRDDPINPLMAASPLEPVPGLPRPRVLGFLACGAVVRRAAFLAVGGFDPAFQVGGEEELLALDLEAAGHRSVYAAEVLARHHPEPREGDDGGRARRQARNLVWVPWMRLPVGQAAAESCRFIRSAWRDPAARGGLLDAARGWGRVRRRRRLVPPAVRAARACLRTGIDQTGDWNRGEWADRGPPPQEVHMARKPSAGRTHKAVAEEAGFKRVSLISILAGTVTGYGAFAVLAALVGAAFSAADVDTDFRTNDWASTESLGGIATAVTLLLAYLFGGYVAGRMARRAGVLHGVAVFVLSLIGGVAVGGLVAGLGDDQDVEQNLRSIGVPTSWDEWGDVGTATAIAALVLMAVGAILGGMLGERWHTKLARRAADPEYGPEAKARREFEAAEGERDQRIESDDLVRRDRDDMAAQAEADEHEHRQELDEEAELEREREEERALKAGRKQEKEQEEELEAVRADEREREDERIRDLDQDDEGHRVVDVRDTGDDEGHRVVDVRADDAVEDGHRVADVRADDAVEDGHRVADVRADDNVDDRDVAAAAGTTEGAHSSGIDDEPRYTAAEWAELQRSQEVGRSRS